jgi:hypothetical protein
MKPVRQSLTRLKLTDMTASRVMPEGGAAEPESAFTNILKRLKREETCTKGIGRFERIIKQAASHNRAYSEESSLNVFLLTYKPY